MFAFVVTLYDQYLAHLCVTPTARPEIVYNSSTNLSTKPILLRTVHTFLSVPSGTCICQKNQALFHLQLQHRSIAESRCWPTQGERFG